MSLQVPSRPYPDPVPIKTTLRCKFSLPGRKYNCRAVGKYVLDGKGYCARHYDTTWKVFNPEHGQQHEWRDYRNGLGGSYPCCVRCGVVKVYDGLPQSLCAGLMPAIRLCGVYMASGTDRTVRYDVANLSL